MSAERTGLVYEALEHARADGDLSALAALLRTTYRPDEGELRAITAFSIGDGTSKPETARHVRHLAKARNAYADLRHDGMNTEEAKRRVAAEFNLTAESVDRYVVRGKDRRVRDAAKRLRSAEEKFGICRR